MIAAIGGVWAPAAMRAVRTAASQASKVIRNHLANVTRPADVALEPVYARISRPRQPIHPSALLRQQKCRRWHSTSTYQNIDAAVRRFVSTGRINPTPRVERSKFLNTSQAGRGIAQLTGRSPFSSALRPNLTGGALPRTAGGYGLGSGRVGGTRYFSHAPACQAEVVQNVSAAVRAFWLSGQRAQFDGLSHRGEKRYRAIFAVRAGAARKMATVTRYAPGSYVDFSLVPTMPALSPLAAGFPYTAAGTKISLAGATTLNTEGFLDILSVDFGRALKDLTATLADVKKLSSLGDLPVHLERAGQVLRVRFPGVDAETVESLCEDLGLTRGIVREDAEFEELTGVTMALHFPFATVANSQERKTLESIDGSLKSLDSFQVEEALFDHFSELEDNPWLSPAEGYESRSPSIVPLRHNSDDYEDLDGIHRFLEDCDGARSIL